MTGTKVQKGEGGVERRASLRFRKPYSPRPPAGGAPGRIPPELGGASPPPHPVASRPLPPCASPARPPAAPQAPPGLSRCCQRSAQSGRSLALAVQLPQSGVPAGTLTAVTCV